MSDLPTLPDTLPVEPLSLVNAWLKQAMEAKLQPNPNAMTLATADQHGRPAARVVLLKELVPQPGYLVFYTNYDSQKGRHLKENPRAAAVLHWDSLGRQIRIAGPVLRSPDEESDAYFAGRDAGSQMGAWASRQSEPLKSRQALLDQFQRIEQRFAGTHPIPRPENWGGYRLWAETVELWLHGENRIHDRALWQRSLYSHGPSGFGVGEWSATRLQP